ncbi:MAG: hypothetical protein RIS29_3011 [Bacteroidota bacterium]
MAGELLSDNLQLSYRLKGRSMFPTLRPGDIGLVEKCAPEDLQLGDIVVFNQNGLLIGHRLVLIEKSDNQYRFITRGDNCPLPDPVFSEQQLLGRIRKFTRKGKTYSTVNFCRKLAGKLIMRFPKLALKRSAILLRLVDLNLRINKQSISFRKNIRDVSAGSGKLLLTNALINILQGVLPFVIIVCIKALVDLLTETQNSFQQTLFFGLLGLTAAVFLLSGLLSEISSYYSEKLAQSVSKRIYAQLHQKHTELDLSVYENPERQDKIHRAVQEASFRPIKLLGDVLMGIKSIASALFLLGLFISIRWYLVLILFVAIVPGILFRFKIARKLYRLKERQSTREREMYYYNRILTGFPFAKELRLFGFADFFRTRFNRTQDSLFAEKLDLRKSEVRLGLFAQLFAVILIFGSLGMISILKLKGEISIGTVVLFFFAFQRGYSVLNELFQSVTRIIEDNTYLNDFVEFMESPTTSNKTSTVDFTLNEGIIFKNVSFHYETSQRNALQNINVSIPAGKTVALVGANGSGKSTFIKLLCGFYQPDSGQILFDNTVSTQIGSASIRNNISAVFQDFALYNISALGNLALGDARIPANLEKAREAARAAGVDQVLESLPNGYETMLGNLFKGGEELSIGQWQKIAIARAYYRNAPLILMDEPSSALDVNSERQVIEGLKKLSAGKTAVIVSHRLSTIDWADLIFFFENGEIVEQGSHAELMALKGKYAGLFSNN